MTVSRVLNDRPGVSDATRARVRAAIEGLGYRQNLAARTLAGGRSGLLGAVNVNTAFHGPSQTLFGIEAAARASDRMLTFVSLTDPTSDKIALAIETLADAHVEGLIINAPVRAAVDALAEVQASVRLPLVVTSHDATAGSSVAIDQEAGARTAVRHLLELGHDTVHHVGGAKGWVDADLRAKGWRSELRAWGRSAPSPVLGSWTARSGYDAGRKLAADPAVTAIFVANDEMATGVVLALHEARRTVPDDVSVVGFDDAADAAFRLPPLTTIRQDFDELGRRSVARLISMLDGGAPQRETIQPELVIRSSTRSR